MKTLLVSELKFGGLRIVSKYSAVGISSFLSFDMLSPENLANKGSGSVICCLTFTQIVISSFCIYGCMSCLVY